MEDNEENKAMLAATIEESLGEESDITDITEVFWDVLFLDQWWNKEPDESVGEKKGFVQQGVIDNQIKEIEETIASIKNGQNQISDLLVEKTKKSLIASCKNSIDLAACFNLIEETINTSDFTVYLEKVKNFSYESKKGPLTDSMTKVIIDKVENELDTSKQEEDQESTGKEKTIDVSSDNSQTVADFE